MWFKNIFRRPNNRQHTTHPADNEPLFDENFLRRLQRLSLQAQRTLRGHPSGGEHASRHTIPSSIFSDHRPYASGDDMRYIDWNAYARQEHLLLKLGEAEQDIDIHLLLDVSRSMLWGSPPKLRSVQQMAGALGYLALAHSDRVHIVPFGETTLQPFGPARGKGRLMEMLRYIETVSPQPQTSLSSILQNHSRVHRRGGLLVLCSDMLSPEGLYDGLQALQPPRWQILVMHILDPRELRPELHGSMELHDSETGQRLPITLDDNILEAYHKQVTSWQEQLASICARRGATYDRILTSWPMEKQVIPYLRKRRLLI
jgi:uncharacterized protein (DUF58 family)